MYTVDFLPRSEECLDRWYVWNLVLPAYFGGGNVNAYSWHVLIVDL